MAQTAESGREIFRVRAHNLDTVPAAGSAIERLTVSLGLSSIEASRFRFAVEELCAERITHAFPEGEGAEVDVSLKRRAGEIVVTVHDVGSPVEAQTTAAGARGWLAHLLRRGFADELRASFRGREGNHCELVKFVSSPVVTPAPKAEAAAAASPTAAAIEYREMTPEDALELTRCFYRTYRLSAPLADEVIYHPERCAEQVRAGLHLAMVAVTPNGTIVGHNAVTREAADDPLGVAGFLVVDPEFRGHGIGERVTELTFARARATGLRGMLAMAVTVHTASQKTSLKNGAIETGVLLAAQEARVTMLGIPDKEQHTRHAMMACYFPFQPDQRRESFPPPVYREIVGQISALCGLERVIPSDSRRVSLTDIAERSALDVRVMRGAHFARIRVGTFGRDFISEIFHLMDDLHRHNLDVLRLELPLADPLTAVFGSAAEELGFSFGAIFPCTTAGDLLCLQSLDRIEVDPALIHVASEHGQAVLSAVLASRERVLGSTTARTISGASGALQSALEGLGS
ncbi:MAG TPA: GNAT family N-acetyltransferase [Candidatus Binataceae bacterium]|nr:GNAT family N-acetyltransferase [Candidatus Binataceae bacterium]